ncbi:MAG TPA: cation-translocating P-type ATPase [Terriglobales bacterium]|nr:cation-translocating P-type ATPase [Terriglobales bacterium]
MSNSIEIRPADRTSSATEKQQSLDRGCSAVECEEALRDGHEHHDHAIERADAVRIGLVAIAAAMVWFRIWEPFRNISIIGLAAALLGGYPIFKEAVNDILERRMTMELSMTIALVAALLIGEFFTALVIMIFVLVAEVLEGLTVGRGRRALRDILDLLPQTATLLRNGQPAELPIDQVRVGDLILVRPGSRIPVDGKVLRGDSFVDESSITGESMPVEKKAGTAVYAGTINQSGAMEIEVAAVGLNTTFGKIIEIVEEAERSKAPIQKTADRLAGYLVYFALGAAALTLLITHNVRSTISVVIVAGACGIAAGTPLAILGAIGRAAKLGSIVKGGIHLEQLGTVDTVFLDKTGTVTFGTPEVLEIRPEQGFTEREVLDAAATAEWRSEHPFGKAIVKRAVQNSLLVTTIDSFEYIPGRGVIAKSSGVETVAGSRALLKERGLLLPAATDVRGASEILIAKSGVLLGSILIADHLRPEATESIAALKDMGMRTALITGDAKAVAYEMAKALKVDRVYAELLPSEKANCVAKYTRKGRKIAMVGDGINDALALVKADVGVAMGSGTDVARETGDVILIGNDLAKFVETLRIARKCRRIILQNFYGTLIVDGVGVFMAAFGLLNPLLAAFIHVSSELAFITNSTRLLPARR